MTDKEKQVKLRQLIITVACGDIKQVKKFIKNSEEYINLRDKLGNTPLMTAVEAGNVQIAEMLIKSGANTNLPNKKGNTALMEAISHPQYANRYAMIKMLLRNGADANYIGKYGRTPLYLCKLYQPRYINLLRRYGAVC